MNTIRDLIAAIRELAAAIRELAAKQGGPSTQGGGGGAPVEPD